MSKIKLILPMTAALFVFAACAAKPPTEAATETEPTAAATEEASPVAVASAVPDTECLNCHTDKQRLIDTAAPVVEAEGESKGVG
ncbi:MAG: hypothetical protein LDL50_03510 [Chloroflexi bacterium]|nr:hypothetical protein [Chloroflexota bacterium]MCA2000628.1 hypothetical protein [Chloroflexota bacterium]